MAQKAHIFIQAKEARVNPPVLVLDKNEKFKIENTTDETFDLTFPNGVLVQGTQVSIQNKTKVELGAGQTGGVFSYTGQGATSGMILRGNSDPVIIIEM